MNGELPLPIWDFFGFICGLVVDLEIFMLVWWWILLSEFCDEVLNFEGRIDCSAGVKGSDTLYWFVLGPKKKNYVNIDFSGSLRILIRE